MTDDEDDLAAFLDELGLKPADLDDRQKVGEAFARRSARMPGYVSGSEPALDAAISLLNSFGAAGVPIHGLPDLTIEVPPSTSVPIELIGEFEPDPLTFTVILERAATATEVDDATAWVERLGNQEAVNDDDHVSYWSEVSAARLTDTGAPTLTWWFDAAHASPATIRRLMEGTDRYLVESGLPARRILVGNADEVT